MIIKVFNTTCCVFGLNPTGSSDLIVERSILFFSAKLITQWKICNSVKSETRLHLNAEWIQAWVIKTVLLLFSLFSGGMKLVKYEKGRSGVSNI